MPSVRQPVLVIAAIAVVAMAHVSASAPAADDNAEKRLAALQRWLAAVEEHQPGRRDAAAERVAAWNNDQLRALLPYLETLTFLLPSPSNPDAGWRRHMSEKELAPLRDLARAYAARGEVNRIMKWGALLHADVMMSGAAQDRQFDSARAARREAQSGGSVAVLGIDGEHEGFAVIPLHWMVARQLLDAVHPDPASDGFVRLWYRATTAYMLQRSQWGDAERQLRHARERLTPDAHLHLDSGSLYEAYANPRAQAMMTSAARRGVRFDVQSVPHNLQLAEMHFKQATVLDPALIEARVRLARVRILLGRPAEAVPDLQSASIAATDPAVRYYAVLFLGQAEDALGRADEARAAYQRAAALYPMSQAPHLALSLIARESGDRDAAQIALRNFLYAPAPDRVRYDPWWAYFMGSGRNMRALVLQLWRAAAGEASR